jgi:hypothetical protein
MRFHFEGSGVMIVLKVEVYEGRQADILCSTRVAV